MSGTGSIATSSLLTVASGATFDISGANTNAAVRSLAGAGTVQLGSNGLFVLAGKTVHVRKSSSYYESLTALNEQNRKAGRPEVVLRLVPDALEDEDMMEMANAGVIDFLIVDDWKAKVWAQVLPRIAVHQDVSVREEGQIGWAIRKESPQLAAAIEAFFVNFALKRASYEYLLAAVLGEEIDIGTWLTASDARLSMRRHFQMRRACDGATLFRGDWDLVCIRISSGRPARMPPEFLACYEPAVIRA